MSETSIVPPDVFGVFSAYSAVCKHREVAVGQGWRIAFQSYPDFSLVSQVEVYYYSSIPFKYRVNIFVSPADGILRNLQELLFVKGEI